MKITTIVNPSLQELELLISCPCKDDKIIKLEKLILEQMNEKISMIFYKENREFYFSLEEILFFETEGNNVYAHTKTDVYKVKYRLYELEEILPKYFTRISKSAIINIQHVYSVNSSISTYSLIQFYNTHKQVYASRLYYKNLKEKLKEGRNL